MQRVSSSATKTSSTTRFSLALVGLGIALVPELRLPFPAHGRNLAAVLGKLEFNHIDMVLRLDNHVVASRHGLHLRIGNHANAVQEHYKKVMTPEFTSLYMQVWNN